MRVTFFPSCLTDTFFAESGADAVRLLRSLGVDPRVEASAVCCGQAAHNAGFAAEAARTLDHTIRALPPDAPVVVASGSCAAMLAHGPGAAAGPQVYELTQFIVRVLGAERVGADLGGLRVAYHHGCHALRVLGASREPLRLLEGAGAEVVAWEADVECCGFGGLFSAKFPEVSVAMADRKLDTLPPDVDVVTSADGGCLLQLSSRARARGTGPPLMHVASLLWRGVEGC